MPLSINTDFIYFNIYSIVMSLCDGKLSAVKDFNKAHYNNIFFSLTYSITILNNLYCLLNYIDLITKNTLCLEISIILLIIIYN